MLAFCPRGHGRFSFRAVFHREKYCNLSFYDATQSEILYHLSLRADEGLAVSNRRGKGPKSWHRERKKSLAIASTGVEVDIHFEGKSVRVRIDGSEVPALGSGILRRFPNLDQIAFADFQGGLLGPTLDMDVMLHDALGSSDALRLNQRLELRGRVRSGERLLLDLPDMQLPPPLITTTKGDTQILRAVIPGRIWQSVPLDQELNLAIVNHQGSALAAMNISRAAMAERITRLLEDSPSLYGDLLAATQIVEHVRFAELAERLSPDAITKLTVLARSHGLEDFLGPIAPPSKTARPRFTRSSGDRHRKTVDACVADYVLQMRSDPNVGPAEALGANPPDKSILRDVCLNLTELACRTDRPGAFEALHKTARDLGQGKMPEMDNPWSQSAVLPWRVLDGDVAAISGPLQDLAWNRRDWILTSPVAWTVSRLLDHPPKDATVMAWTIEAFLSFVNENANSYWGRSPCVELCRASAKLLQARHRFTEPLSRKIASDVLRVYGLTPTFWSAMDAEDLSEDVARFRDAWKAVQQHLDMPRENTDALKHALAVLAQADCIDLPRFRRDLIGQTGKPDQDIVEETAGEAALRYLAHPATPNEAANDHGLAKLAHDAMPKLYKETERGEHGSTQRNASIRAAQMLASARSGAKTIDAEHLTDLVTDLSAIKDECGIGPGLGLSLIAGLIKVQQDDAAQEVLEAILPLFAGSLTVTPPISRAQAQLLNFQDNGVAGRALALLGDLPGREDKQNGAACPQLEQDVSPLHDTLITVFSCAAHLETRVPQMRNGWLRDLRALGVPYVIIVGGGTDPDGVLDGDILTLAAADDYEGLPQKTLAVVKWVHNHTRFAHFFKVDDDCFLNADVFFHAQSHAKFDYYGRPLTRIVGQMDRSWHVAKSTTDRGKLELDKSPEPSLYADGGSGYVLSRRAMGAALRALKTPEGQSLLQTSFMEDKLLGDLLALQGIFVEGEDYHISVRRREAPGGITIPRWVNGFDASQTMPVKLVHLDDPTAQGAAYARLKTPAVRPAKIWPSYQDAALGPHSNTLELISNPSRLDAAQDAPVSVVACMRNEMFMLPLFLDHYRKLGVESFLIADNCSDDGTLEFLAEEPDVAVFSVDTEYSRSFYGVAWQQALMAAFRVNRWSVVADADEMLLWQNPQTQSLPEMLGQPAFSEKDAARIFMLDMYPKGSLAEATFKSGDPFEEAGYVEQNPFLETSAGRGPYSDNPTWTSALRHRLIPGSRPDLFVAQKLALLKYRPWMRMSAGLHYVSGVQLAEPELFFAHFKYNADFRRKVQAEVARGQHFNDAEEYRKYLAVVSEGRDVIYEPEHSVHWTKCEFVKSRLRAQSE